MDESLRGYEGKETALYESIRSRPITPSARLKVTDSERDRASTRHASPPHDPAKSFQICIGEKDDTTTIDNHYGLQILGCNAPGISERPISAVTRLGGFIDCEDYTGDTVEVTDDFQKLKIARNQLNTYNGMHSSIPRDAVISSSGITIQSLTSNTVVVVPETHRNLSSRGGGLTGHSSVEELRVHPATKSKITKRRRKRRAKVSPTRTLLHGTHSWQTIQSSMPDEGENDPRGGGDGSSSGNRNKQKSFQAGREDDDCESDCGGSDRDYTVPQTALSTMFDVCELMRPDTASSEILGDSMLACKEETLLKELMKILQIRDDDNWYSGIGDDANASGKNKLRQLTKLFYRREEMSSSEGRFYTYKLMLGGLHNRLEDFVLLPVPPGFSVKTRITRVKKGVDGRLYPVYYMHLEREGPGDRKCLVLVAKKRKCLRGTCYILSTDPAELTPKSEYCVGLVTSNFIGTEFTLLSGRSICTHIPPEKGALTAVSKQERFKEELALILYDPNVLGFKGPRKIKVIVPKMKNLLEREEIRPRITEESLGYQYRNQEKDSIWTLKNKDPSWSRETHSYILNFAGRVSTPSVKNFQVVSGCDEEHIMLQFGRQSENTFCLDFRYPFCPLQAFAIALSSFESKLACE